MADRIVSGFYISAMSGFARYVHQELGIVPDVDYRIVKPSNEPRVLNVLIQINPKHFEKLAQTKMQEQLAMAMALPADRSVRIARGPGGSIALEIPKPKSLCFHLKPASLPTGAIGLDTLRRPARINWRDPETAHILIAGLTRSGKTNTQQLVAWGRAIYDNPAETKMIIIDVEKAGRSWGQFENVPHLAHPVVVDDEEALRVLTWCVAELDRRRTEKRSYPLFIFIDELESLMKMLKAADGVELLARIARAGGEWQMHLVVATQHPTIEALGDEASLRRNLGIRVVSRVDDASAAYVATGQKNSGAERLSGPGDSLFVHGSDMRRMTVALLTDSEYSRLPRAETVARLPLDELGDPERVLDVAIEPPASSQPDPLDMKQLAYALATGRGITHLASLFSIGSTKAKRVKEHADELRDELRRLGYILTDTGEMIE